MNVHFFGQLAEAVAPELDLEVPRGISVAGIRGDVIARYPEAEGLLRKHGTRACIGSAIVSDDYVPEISDTVEVLPPVSGG